MVHSRLGDIEFYQRGDLYLADFRPYVTDRALNGMTTQERDALFDKATVKRAQEAGVFVRNAGYPSEQVAINLVRSGNINNMPIDVQDVKNFFEIYGTPVAAIRGKTTENKSITGRDNYDSGLREQITIQEQISDVMYLAGRKFLVSMMCPLQVVVVVPITALKREALGKAVQSHIDLVRMFGFDVRIIFVDPFKALAGLRGSIPGVEVQPTGAGDHLPKLDIRIRRLKEMARAVLNGLDYKLPISFVNQLVTFCVSRINVQTTSSLTSNMCPRIRMTGRKVDYKKEYSLTFGEYAEARNPQVVSNSMAPRTDPCIAPYPTLNVNGSWKFYNLRLKKVVSRSQYVKSKHTPNNIVSAMNLLAASKGILKSDDVDVGPNFQDDIQGQGVEPGLHVHMPDPNVIEIINENVGSTDDDDLVYDDEEQIVQE